MKYDSVRDLPESVRENLPEQAQEIYLEAFNSAWEFYEDPDKRDNPDDSREEVAHKVAWSAVKEKYEKRDGNWVRQ